MNKKIWVAVVAIAFLVGTFGLFNQEGSLGSVNQANEYHTTTTPSGASQYSSFYTPATVLGSIVITSSTADAFYVYDWDTATSTVSSTVAYFANSPAGTYTFDIALFNGLVIEPVVTTTGFFVTTYR